MNVIRYPKESEWSDIVKRPVADLDTLRQTVGNILQAVKQGGDKAVMAYEEQFDKARLLSLRVTPEEVDEACALVDDELKEAMTVAKENIEKFHAAQRFESKKVETLWFSSSRIFVICVSASSVN